MVENDSSQSDPLFSPDLVPATATSALPTGYRLRPLQCADYEGGFLAILNAPENARAVSKAQFERRFAAMKPRDMAGSYVLVVLGDDGNIVGTGTLLLEMKLYARFTPRDQQPRVDVLTTPYHKPVRSG